MDRLADEGSFLYVLAFTSSAYTANKAATFSDENLYIMLKHSIVQTETEFINRSLDGSQLLGRGLDGKQVRWFPPSSKNLGVDSFGIPVKAKISLNWETNALRKQDINVLDIDHRATNGVILVIDGVL